MLQQILFKCIIHLLIANRINRQLEAVTISICHQGFRKSVRISVPFLEKVLHGKLD